MIELKEKPNTSKEILNILNPLIRKWFFSRFKEFSLPQLFGVIEYSIFDLFFHSILNRLCGGSSLNYNFVIRLLKSFKKDSPRQIVGDLK